MPDKPATMPSDAQVSHGQVIHSSSIEINSYKPSPSIKPVASAAGQSTSQTKPANSEK